MASHSVTIGVKYDAKWGDIKAQADDAGVPDNAHFDLHVVKGYNQMDPGYEEIVFTWGVSKKGIGNVS